MGLLLFYMGIALGVSFVCSVMEATLLSVTPSYVGALTHKGHAAGARLERLKADVDKPLSAILTLNTIAHTAGAIGVGAQAESVFGSAWVGALSVVMTLLILVVSEIIPKTIGAAYWRTLAPLVSRLLVWLVVGLLPFVWLSQRITRLVSRDRPIDAVSRDELRAMAALGAKQGIFAKGESAILQNLLRLGRLKAEDIMTPRTVLYALPDGETVGGAFPRVQQTPFSRIPVYLETLDNVTGYVLRDDVLLHAARDEMSRPLADLRRPIKAVPASQPLPSLFDDLLRGRAQIAIVIDEFGGTAGVVTLEDLIETLLGLEIVDEIDRVDDMQELARERWKQRARGLGLPVEVEPAPPAVDKPTAPSDGSADKEDTH